MTRYYVADTWSDGAYDYCYIVTMSTKKGVQVFIALVIGEHYILLDDCTEAVQNVVPLAEMFEGAYEIEAKNIFARISREEINMPRKKEFQKAVLVRMSDEQHEKLQKIADAKKTSSANVLREYIKRAKCPK